MSSAIIPQTSDIFHLPSYIIPQTSSLSLLPSYIFHLTSAIIPHPSSIFHLPSSLIPHPSSILLQGDNGPEPLSCDPAVREDGRVFLQIIFVTQIKTVVLQKE